MVMSQELHNVKTRVVSIVTDVGLYLHIFGWNSPQLQELEFKVNKKRIIMLVGFLSFQLFKSFKTKLKYNARLYI